MTKRNSLREPVMSLTHPGLLSFVTTKQKAVLTVAEENKRRPLQKPHRLRLWIPQPVGERGRVVSDFRVRGPHPRRPREPSIHVLIVAEERGFLKLSRALKLITQRRFFCGGSLLLSGRVIHRDGDSLILEPQRSSRTAFLLRTGLISPFGNRAVESRHLVRAWLASRDPIDCFGQRHIPAPPWCSMTRR